MEGAADTYRFLPTAASLEAFFRRYEEERERGGISSTLLHVSPRQRMDTVTTILGLNASRGWRRVESDTAESLWLRYLSPVLAETRESAAALAFAVRAGLPGRFEPPLPVGKTEPQLGGIEVEKQSWNSRWLENVGYWLRDFGSWLRRGWLNKAVLVFGLLLLLAGAARLSGADTQILDWLRCTINPTSCSNGGGGGGGGGAGGGGGGGGGVTPHEHGEVIPADQPIDHYIAALAVTLAALEQHEAAMTPRALAEIFAGESDVGVSPEIALAAMLRRWPSPPDTPLARDQAGATGLMAYAAVFAEIESGLPRTRLLFTEAETGRHEDRLSVLFTQLQAFGAGGEVGDARPAVIETWPDWLPWLALLPLPLAGIIAWATYRPPLRASLTNPPPGVLGGRIDVPADALRATAPAPARHLARRIAWREPVAGRRLHAERSIRATLASGGFLAQVNRRRRRAAEYLFLVQRRRDGDHERDRANRIIDALARAGLDVHAYDYDRDPRAVMPRDPHGSASHPLDLRGLRERHPDARLVLVTDGTELVDRFTLDPLPFVAGQLAAWPARMLLTPLPMAEWGEREMNLANALGAPVGRASPEGFEDLALAFTDRPGSQLRSSGGAGGTGIGRRIDRIVAWLSAARQRLEPRDDFDPRPTSIRFDDAWLRSEAIPPEPAQKALLVELRQWLGADGYLWLAACASYPQLRYSVTTYLGLNVTRSIAGLTIPIYGERPLARLALLPWFRLGRMPRWLRRGLLDSLPDAVRSRVRNVVDQMLNGPAPLPSDGDGRKTPHLPIWLPKAGREEIAPDEVLADLIGKQANEIDPELREAAFKRIFEAYRRDALATRFAWIAALAVWCGAAWLLWPPPASAPHVQGAWLPLIVLGIGSLAAPLLWRWWRGRWPGEQAPAQSTEVAQFARAPQ